MAYVQDKLQLGSPWVEKTVLIVRPRNIFGKLETIAQVFQTVPEQFASLSYSRSLGKPLFIILQDLLPSLVLSFLPLSQNFLIMRVVPVVFVPTTTPRLLGK